MTVLHSFFIYVKYSVTLHTNVTLFNKQEMSLYRSCGIFFMALYGLIVPIYVHLFLSFFTSLFFQVKLEHLCHGVLLWSKKIAYNCLHRSPHPVRYNQLYLAAGYKGRFFTLFYWLMASLIKLPGYSSILYLSGL